jgi:hypothetical protein
MGVRSITYGGGLSADTNRGPSEAIWGSCPVEELIQDPRLGQYFFDDFAGTFPGFLTVNTEDVAGQWTGFTSNNAACKVGTSADTTNLPLEGGVLGLTAGSNNNLTITLAANQSSFRLVSPASGFPTGQKLWFETSIAVSAVASGNFDLFVGLMDTGDGGTRITSAADLVFSAANTIKTAASMGGCIGFWKRATSNPADVAIVHNVNNGTAQVLGASGNIQKLSTNYGPGAMAALSVTNGAPKAIGDSSGACFLKLGFVFDPMAYPKAVATALTGQTAGQVVKPLVTFYVNGKPIPVFYDFNVVQASTFPSTWMAPVIGFRSGGSGAGVAYVDFVRCAQVANS